MSGGIMEIPEEKDKRHRIPMERRPRPIITSVQKQSVSFTDAAYAYAKALVER